MAVQTHEASAEMRGDPRAVLDALVIALASSGFRVERRTDTEVELTGPAGFGSQHQAVVGASRIVAKAAHRRLVLTAELGQVARLRRFLTFFPPAMCVALFGVLGIVFAFTFDAAKWKFVGGLLGAILGIQVVTWLILGPLIARKFESKAKAAIDALATSVATIGGSR